MCVFLCFYVPMWFKKSSAGASDRQVITKPSAVKEFTSQNIFSPNSNVSKISKLIPTQFADTLTQ